MSADWDIKDVRARFPALRVEDAVGARVHLDNPAGTQVPLQVVDRITGYLSSHNANRGGHFATAWASDAVIDAARSAVATFVNAAAPEEIIFGPNMTSLTFQMTRTLAPRLAPGDEILLTRMDHDGNVTPWRLLAERTGAVVRWLEFNRETYRFDLGDLDRLVGPRTRIAALNYASNITGTINDVAAIAERVRSRASPISTRCSTLPTATLTYRLWAATSWSAQPTNSMDPMRRCCGAAAICSMNFALTSCSPRRTSVRAVSRRAAKTTRASPAFSAQSSITPNSAGGASARRPVEWRSAMRNNRCGARRKRSLPG